MNGSHVVTPSRSGVPLVKQVYDTLANFSPTFYAEKEPFGRDQLTGLVVIWP